LRLKTNKKQKKKVYVQINKKNKNKMWNLPSSMIHIVYTTRLKLDKGERKFHHGLHPKFEHPGA
jgi:hypothetical protein